MPSAATTRAVALAAAAGLLYWAAQPPLGVGWLGFVALAPLVLAVREASLLRAGLLGWIAGTIAFNGLTSPSVYEALVRARHPVWLAAAEAFAVPQLTGALHMAAFAAYAAVLERRWRGRPARLFVLAAAWVAAELGRARIGHGMPWVLLAHSQTSHLPWLQVADVAGAAGTGFVLALVSAAVATAATDRASAARRPLGVALLGAALVTALAYAYGERAMARWGDIPGARIRVALVQGAVPAAWRYALPHVPDALARYRALIAQAVGSRPDLVVLPETAVSISPDANPSILRTIASALGDTKAALVVGAPRTVMLAPDRAATRNSAYLLDSAGAVRGLYDKRHLVPFGEMSTWLLPGGLPRWLGIEEAYSAGDSLPLFAIDGVRFATSICWEGIYPDTARDAVLAGAEFLVNLSNDDWFGPRAATEQHFRATLLRAIETRRFLVRVTNSGLTAVVDPRGAVVAAAPRDEPAVVSAEVVPLDGATPYTRVGDAFSWACTLAAALALVAPASRGYGGR